MIAKLKVISERYFSTTGCPFCHQGEQFLVRGAVTDGIEYQCMKCYKYFIASFGIEAAIETVPLRRLIKRKK